MKKLYFFLLSVILIAALTFTAFAAGDVTFGMEASEDTLSAGDALTLTASCTANAEATSYGLMLKYDENVFEYVSGDVTVENTMVKSMGAGTSHGFVFMFQEATAYSGTVGTAVLKVKESAPAGTYVITGAASVKNGAETVETEDCSVTVTVSGQADVQESTAASDPVDIGGIIESITLPEISKPEPEEVTDETVQSVGVPVESMPPQAADSTLTVGADIVPEKLDEGIPSWIFLVAAGVIAVVGIAAFVMVKKKK